jgi:hypothetical protein
MSDERSFAREEHLHRFLVKDHSDLICEIAASPPVVVASHEVNRDTGIADLAKEMEHPIVAGWNPGSPFEPEVEEVSVQEDQACRSAGKVEPT